jgi:DNA-binding response OmpR family regulator
MEKPFHADELKIRVRKLLEMRRMLREKWSLSEQLHTVRPLEIAKAEPKADDVTT